jgi:hypothetical protein
MAKRITNPVVQTYQRNTWIWYGVNFALAFAISYVLLCVVFTHSQSSFLAFFSAWGAAARWFRHREKNLHRYQAYKIRLWPHWQKILEHCKLAPNELQKFQNTNGKALPAWRGESAYHDIEFTIIPRAELDPLVYQERDKTLRTLYGRPLLAEIPLPPEVLAEATESIPSDHLYLPRPFQASLWIDLCPRGLRFGVILPEWWIKKRLLKSSGGNFVELAVIPAEEFAPYCINANEYDRLWEQAEAWRDAKREEYGWESDSRLGNAQRMEHDFCVVDHHEI